MRPPPGIRELESRLTRVRDGIETDGDSMTEKQYEAISHLKAWVRDYGHAKEPAFIRDIETVLAMVTSTKEITASDGRTSDGR
jgi:hypothetical protein